MCFGKLVIEFKRLLNCPLCLWPAIVRRQHAPCRPEAVKAVQSTVAERVRRVFFNCAMKIVAALGELFRRVLPPVISPLQVKLVRFCALSMVLDETCLIFLAEFE